MSEGISPSSIFLRYSFLPGNFSEFKDDFNLFVGWISHAEGNHLFSLIKYFFKYCKTSSCDTRRLYLLNTLPNMNRFLKGWTTVYTRSHTVFSLGKTNFSLVPSYFLFQFQLFSLWIQKEQKLTISTRIWELIMMIVKVWKSFLKEH